MIIVGMIMFKDIISPLHILYIDLVADVIPSIALAFEKDNKDSMKQKPYGLKRRVFTPFMISSIITTALIEAGLCLGVFIFSNKFFGYDVAQTLTLLTIVLNEFVFTYNCKELKTFSFKKGLFGNKVMNISTLILTLVQVLVFFTPIGLLFGLVEITALQFLAVVGVNIVGFGLLEIVKPILAKTFKDR